MPVTRTTAAERRARDADAGLAPGSAAAARATARRLLLAAAAVVLLGLSWSTSRPPARRR